MDTVLQRLRGHPAIQTLYGEEQLKVGNKINLNIYYDLSQPKGGFNWAGSKDGWSFWHNILTHQDFDTFYKKYPNTSILKSVGSIDSLLDTLSVKTLSVD